MELCGIKESDFAYPAFIFSKITSIADFEKCSKSPNFYLEAHTPTATLPFWQTGAIPTSRASQHRLSHHQTICLKAWEATVSLFKHHLSVFPQQHSLHSSRTQPDWCTGDRWLTRIKTGKIWGWKNACWLDCASHLFLLLRHVHEREGCKHWRIVTLFLFLFFFFFSTWSALFWYNSSHRHLTSWWSRQEGHLRIWFLKWGGTNAIIVFLPIKVLFCKLYSIHIWWCSDLW